MSKFTLIYILIQINLLQALVDDNISDISTLPMDISENISTEKYNFDSSQTGKASDPPIYEDTASSIETSSEPVSSTSPSPSPSSPSEDPPPVELTKSPPQNTTSSSTTTTTKKVEPTQETSPPPSTSEKPTQNLNASDRGSYEPAKARKDDEGKRKSTNKQNPSVDEIISGIIQLIGGNVKLSRPPITPRPQPKPNVPVMIPYSPLRLNNRGPPAFVGGSGGMYGSGNDGGGSHNLPPNILIGPGPIGLPLPTSGFGHQQAGQHFNKIIPLPFPPQHQPSPLQISPSRPMNVQETSYGDNSDVIFPPNKPLLQDHFINTLKETNIKHPTPVSGNHLVPSINSIVKDEHSQNANISQPIKTVTSTITTTKVLSQSDVQNANNIIGSLDTNKKNESLVSSSLKETTLNSNDTSSSSSNRFTTPELAATYTPEESTSHSSEDEPMSNGPVTAWVPFFVESSVGAGKVVPSSWSEEPPQIITKPEEPSTFDITVKHKIGPDNSKPLTIPKISSTKTYPLFEPSSSPPSPTPSLVSSSLSSSTATRLLNSTTSSTAHAGINSSSPTRTRILNRQTEIEPDIVYGRPLDKNNVYGKRKPLDSSPISPSFSAGRPSRPYQINPTRELPNPVMATRTSPLPVTGSVSASTSMLGRPVVIPVEMDDVRPALAGIGGANQATPQVITEPGHGSVFIDGKPTYFKIRPNKPSQPTLHVGSGMTVNAADGDNGHLGIGHLKPLPVTALTSNKNSQSKPSTAARRPPFRPRPNTPLVRIDTCIVGDDSTCGVNLNEHCKTEVGISSCQCKPGFGRTTARGMCSPISSLVMFLRLDKLGDNKIIFNRKLTDPDTEEFQYLEYESIQALNSLFTTSRLGKVFKGVKINKFYSMAGKTLVNATIELDKSNITRSSNIKRIVQQEIIRVISSRNNKLGDSTLSVDESSSAVPRIEDINECANPDLNDCSKFAVCHNEFGGYRCICKPGYDDKYAKDPTKSGRHCASCSPSYCSNRGECLIINGERECRCRGNFIGSKCDIDGEVVGVAVGGSLAAIVIIVITFICLYMWNQRWKKEQQKMEAMSVGSGQTFSYVNKAQSVANYRCTIDDRARWATLAQAQTLPVNANYYYYYY